MHPNELAHLMMPAIKGSTKRAVDKVAKAEFPVIWESLPLSVCQEIYDIASQDAEKFVTALMEGLRSDVLEYFDLEALVVRRAVENKHLVVNMFQVPRTSAPPYSQPGVCPRLLRSLLQQAVLPNPSFASCMVTLPPIPPCCYAAQ